MIPPPNWRDQYILEHAITEELRSRLAGAEAGRDVWKQRATSAEQRIKALESAIDHFLNIDCPMDSCDFCEYNPKSVTPMDGHEETCPIRQLGEVMREVNNVSST